MRALPPTVLSLAWIFLVASAGCESDSSAPPTRTLSSDGRLEIRAGSFERRVALASAECRSSDEGTTVVRAFDTRQPAGDSVSRRPHHLAIKLPQLPDADAGELRLGADGRWQATASLFAVDLHGHTYEMLQFIAARVSGNPFDAECTVVPTDESETWQITCRGAKPIPWLGSGDVPRAGFRATFSCDDGPAPAR